MSLSNTSGDYQFLKLVEELQDYAILLLDRDGNIQNWNKAAEIIKGYRAEEIIKKNFRQFYTQDDQNNGLPDRLLQEAISRGRVSHEGWRIGKGGKAFWGSVVITALHDENGKVKGFLKVTRDLTEPRKASIQLKEANEELSALNEELKASNEELNALNEQLISANKLVESKTLELLGALKKEKELVQMKNQFVSMASHELRTPLSVILLNASFILRYKAKIEQEVVDEKVASIMKQVDFMNLLLEDFLKLGKIDEGRIVAETERLEIKQVESLAREIFLSSNVADRLKVIIDCPFDFFYTDEGLLRNIVNNLLSNAIKFSPDNQLIEFKIHGSPTSIILTVQDNGIGIPEKDRENLFTSFSRGSNVRHIPGTGLGLSIVKKAVEILNGTIEMNTKVGQGTEVIVTLPRNENNG
jgi:PAS domain S-box-containing protein